ncbi:MAG: family 16 glycoside hydrolase, partial [Verrucomicrobiota bacterium]
LNNGVSWGSEIFAVAQPGGGSLRPGMSQMARMANGKYLLVYELVGSGNADVYCKTSDDGVTWPSGLGTRIPCQHCGPFVTALPDGRVFITSCENEVSFSEDFGETWQKIDPPAWNLGYAFSWPAIYATKTNELGVMAVAPSVKLRFGALSPPKVWPNPFTDNFNSGTDTNWTRYGTNVAFSNGRYLLNNTNTYGKALVGDNFWTDGTLETDVLLSSTTGDAGMLFRATSPDYVGPDDMSGYYAGLRASGSVFLGKMNYSWTELISAAMTVGTNTWHHLKVVAQGASLKVYVNDMATPKITWADNTHRRGQIGVRTFQSNAQFDNITFSNATPLRLNLQLAANQLQFSWLQNAYNLQLAGTSSLTQSANWLPVTNSPTLSNGQWNLSLPLPAPPAQFYRLQTK